MIRLICLLILVLGIQLNGKCDTITNWQVYHNEKLIAKLNIYNEGFEILINKEKLKEGDTIIVNYFRDTPCFDCKSFLSVEDGKHHHIVNWSGKGTFTPKKFLVDELLKSEKEYFEIWYHEGEIKSRTERQFLFRIKLE